MKFLTSLLKKPLVGLDIGVSGIKAVELSGRKTPRLVAYNRVPLPRNCISSDGEIRDREMVITALKKLFEARAFSSNKVAVGASGNSVMTKKISVPKMSSNELANQLYFEAEQYIPFSASEVNLDFAVLGPSGGSQTGSGTLDVLLVAAKKDYVANLTQLIEEAGLKAEVIDNQAFALGNAFEFNYGYLTNNAGQGAVSVIIDFGAGSTKISIVEGDKTSFTRDLRQSGISCTQMLGERLGVPFDQAERIKIDDGATPAVRTITGEFIAILVEEITRTLDYYISQSAERSIQGIYVCGGASRLDGLSPALEARLPAPVQPLNPVQNIAGSGKKMNAQAIRELSYLGSVAIGLSLRTTGDAA